MNRKLLALVAIAALAIPASAQVGNDSVTVRYDTTAVRRDTIDWEKYLDKVTITAAKPLVKMEADKMTYDVANDVDSKTQTVLDMLRKVPMVTVDGQDNITVNGSSAFKVYVDGKQNPMFSQNPSQIFKMMPAAMVEKIEVITNPGAKYDAEGAVGVLNIQLAKRGGATSASSMDGFTGTARLTGSNRGLNGGVSFNAQEGKLSVSGNVMAAYQRMKDVSQTFERQSMTDGNLTRQSLTTTQKTRFGLANLNFSYDIDSLNVVSAAFDVSGFNIRNNYRPLVEVSGGGGAMSYTYDAAMKMQNIGYDLSADWQHFFSGDHDSYITLSYLLSHSPQKSETSQVYDEAAMMPDLFNENHPKSTEHTVQLDFTTPVATGQTLSLGAKYINRRNLSLAEYYSLSEGVRTLMADNTVDYKHLNNIAAAYAEYEASFGIFGAKAGLRYEHTWQDVTYKKGAGEDFSTDYGNLVPSLSVNIRPGMTQNIGITYNMRISRPGITYLNPYVDRTNPMNVTYGNTYLEVEKMHNIGLSYSSFTQKLMVNVGLHQSFCNDRISDYSFYQDGMLYTTYGNIVKERTSSLNVFANWLALPKTRLMMNAGLSYVDMRSDVLDQRNSGWQGNLMLGLQQTLPWDLKLSANAICNTKNYSLQGWSSGFQLGVLGLSKSFMNDRLSISINGVTALSKGGKLKMDSHTSGKDFTNVMRLRVPITMVMCSVSYTFGNTKVQAKQHKSRIENDFTEKKSEQEQVGTSTTGTTGGTGLGM